MFQRACCQADSLSERGSRREVAGLQPLRTVTRVRHVPDETRELIVGDLDGEPAENGAEAPECLLARDQGQLRGLPRVRRRGAARRTGRATRRLGSRTFVVRLTVTRKVRLWLYSRPGRGSFLGPCAASRRNPRSPTSDADAAGA